MNSTEMAPSDLTVLILFSVNLAQQMCLQWPLSMLNIWLQFHTSLIHPNLKCVLLAQSASFCLYGYARSANTILIYVNGVEHWMGGQFIVQLPIMFAIQFMNAIGHILLLERLLATLLSKTYEKIKSVYFSVTWSSLLCIYCGYTAWVQVLGYSTGELKISGFIIFSAYFYAGMALAEFICIIIISGYNAKKFKSQLRIQGHHNLSERFQLKDNIRTARQLGPTFFLHFINIMVSCEFPLVISYGLISELSTIQIYSSITHILITAGNCLIEFTIISRHGILRQNAIQLINRILTKIHIKKNRIRNIGSTNTNTTTMPENKARESEQYFEILKEEWK